jgi:hypothetical protein
MLSPAFPSACCFSSDSSFFAHPSFFRTSSCHPSFSSAFFSNFILFYSMSAFYSSVFFIPLSSVFSPSTHTCPPGCTSTAHSLVFLLLLHTFSTLRIFIKIVSKTSYPTGPQHSPVARPEPLRPVTCSSMPQGTFGRLPFLPPLL